MTSQRTSLWWNRDFNYLWAGHAFSGLGGAMTTLVYPLIILEVTGSPFVAGIAGTAALAVGVATNLPAGVVVDRVDRRRLLLWCNATRLVAFCLLGACLILGYVNLPLILAVMLVESVCEGPFFSAAMASVHNIVPSHHVNDAMARNEARQYAVSLIGPPLGGLLFSVGGHMPFMIVALCCAVSILLINRIKGHLQQGSDGDTTNAGSWVAHFVDGARFVCRDPFVRAAVLIAAPLNMALTGALFGIILLLREAGVTPMLIGSAETIFAAGGVLGALIATAVLNKVAVPTLLRLFCISAVPLLLMIAPLAHSPIATVPIAALALMAPALNAALFGHLASTVPDHLQGRVISSMALAATGLAAFAPLAAGALVHIYGAPGLALGAAGTMAVSAGVAAYSRGIREIRPAVLTN